MRIFWYKKLDTYNRIPLTDNLNKHRLSFTNRSFVIRNPQPSDAGEYQCEAQMSGARNVVRASAKLTVYGRSLVLFIFIIRHSFGLVDDYHNTIPTLYW